ncbi:MAG: LiaF transmembrane domain-containing protein [Candidatus Acidiferrales bacterium]
MTNTSRQSTRGLFIALFIIGLGVVLLLDQQGVISANWDLVWPAAFIFFGLENIACRNSRRGPWGWILLLVGVVLLIDDLGLLRFRIGINDFWALLLIAIGVLMLVGRIKDPIHFHWFENWSDRMSHFRNTGAGDAQFDHFILFSNVKRRIAVSNFGGGKLLAIFGGFNLDLSRAEIEGDAAVIHIDAIFGGGEIRVPDSWAVDIQANAVLGAYTDETHQIASTAAPAKRLIIRGAAVFGGVAIKN